MTPVALIQKLVAGTASPSLRSSSTGAGAQHAGAERQRTSGNMSRLVENCDSVVRAFACFVGAVHHSPRSTDTRSRGSNVLDAAADVLISVVKERDERTAKIEALKDGEEGLSWRFSVTEKRNQSGRLRHFCAQPFRTAPGGRHRNRSATGD